MGPSSGFFWHGESARATYIWFVPLLTCAEVFYIPAVPFSEKNADYVRTQASYSSLGSLPPVRCPLHTLMRG